MTLPLLNATMLERWGGPAGGITLAVIAIGVIVPLAIWVIKDSPEGPGLQPDGGPDTSEEKRLESGRHDSGEWTLSLAMRTTTFWALAVSFHRAMIAQSGFLLHQVLFLQQTLGFIGAVPDRLCTAQRPLAFEADGNHGFPALSICIALVGVRQ